MGKHRPGPPTSAEDRKYELVKLEEVETREWERQTERDRDREREREKEMRYD